MGVPSIFVWLVVGLIAVFGIIVLVFFALYLFGEEKETRIKKEKPVKVKEEKPLIKDVPKTEIKKEAEVKKTEVKVEEVKKDVTKGSAQADLDAMLAKLEAKAQVISVEEKKEAIAEKTEVKPVVKEEKVNEQPKEIVSSVVKKEETIEDIRRRALERVEQRRAAAKLEAMKKSEVVNSDDKKKIINNPVEQNDEKKMEIPLKKDNLGSENSNNEPKSADLKDSKIISIEQGYVQRLQSVKEGYAKIEKDYTKNHNVIVKFERTQRRKERNEKLLNKKATELTNINLVLYNVKDLKNIDPDKKAKQEEISKHIAELKESIREAENYLDANKNTYDNNMKLDEYLSKEKARYEDEIKELEKLIGKSKKA